MKQSAITLVTPVLPDQVDALKRYLFKEGRSINDASEVDFYQFDELHYCAFIIVEQKSDELTCPPVLVMEANIDGEADEYLSALVARAGVFLRTVYAHCEDFPTNPTPTNPSDEQLLDYMKGFTHVTNTFYVGHPGKSRNDVICEQALYEFMSQYIDEHRSELATEHAATIHQKILSAVKAEPSFEWVNTPAEKPWAVRNHALINRLFFPVIALIVLAYFVLGAYLACNDFPLVVRATGYLMWALVLLFVAYIAWREHTDKQDGLDWQDLSVIQEFEDRQPQNHLSSITYVKPGWVRLFTLKAVLALVNLSAKLVATQGNLSGIVTIHFARWVVLEGKQDKSPRLLFFSNYDGSWENYLGEFIDQASLGLSAIWGNTRAAKERGFPNTYVLGFFGGARDEQRFKAYARNSQVTELLWFSAYPKVSVKNIGNNLKLREGLFDVGDNSADWLKRFK